MYNNTLTFPKVHLYSFFNVLYYINVIVSYYNSSCIEMNLYLLGTIFIIFMICLCDNQLIMVRLRIIAFKWCAQYVFRVLYILLRVLFMFCWNFNAWCNISFSTHVSCHVLAPLSAPLLSAVIVIEENFNSCSFSRTLSLAKIN